jgi:hypothetical protein
MTFTGITFMRLQSYRTRGDDIHDCSRIGTAVGCHSDADDIRGVELKATAVVADVIRLHAHAFHVP